MTDETWRLALRTSHPVALVTILATEGSAPRGPGTRMAVTATAITGTIGGGALEHQVIAQARAILSHPCGAWRVQDYPLGPLLGQCCGGRVRLLVERVDPGAAWLGEEGPYRVTLNDSQVDRRSYPGGGRGPDAGVNVTKDSGQPMQRSQLDPGLRRGTPPLSARGRLPGPGTSFLEPDDTARRSLMLFGAGHVGSAVARILPGLPFTLAWFDSRADFDRPGVSVQDEDALVACAGAADAETAVVIMTHDHALDYRLAAAAIASPARYVGMIGSRTKAARFRARLASDGIDPAPLTCPIGIPGTTGKQPAVIAVATLAQLLTLEP